MRGRQLPLIKFGEAMADEPIEKIAFPNRYSYSGSDCKAYICPHGQFDMLTPLESLNTISFSVHEQKGVARALGYKSAKGFARGVRTIAGSLIITVIEDNPFAAFYRAWGESLKPMGWSADREHTGIGSYQQGNLQQQYLNMLPTLLPPMDILLIFSSESESQIRVSSDGTSVKKVAILTDSLIEGLEFVDYGQVTSIHDTVTEINLSWMARNVMPLTREQPAPTRGEPE